MRARGEWHGVHQRITRSLLRAFRSATSHLSRQVADVAAHVVSGRTRNKHELRQTRCHARRAAFF